MENCKLGFYMGSTEKNAYITIHDTSNPFDGGWDKNTEVSVYIIVLAGFGLINQLMTALIY